jgi:RNA polymerase sigma-70 factor (ECF subfamily)
MNPRVNVTASSSAAAADLLEPAGAASARVQSSRAPLEDRDAARLRRLVEAHHAAIWSFIRRLGVPASDVDDAVQRVFLVTARRLAEIDPATEKSFLFGTALRAAADARRTLRRRRETLGVELEERVDDLPLPDELIDRRRARVVVDEVLGQMPLELRAVLVLFEVEELSTYDIAALLELPVGTVGSRLRRARQDFQARVARLLAGRARRIRKGEP